MHTVLRGHDRQPCFFEDMDRRVFLKYLGDAAVRTSCDLHAYVLMTNHVHFLVSGREHGSVSRLMHSVARRYSVYINRKQRRSGSLYEGRFRSDPVAHSTYFLACMRYIELNPVRAGLASHPSQYPWSSFGSNATGEPSGLLVAHSEYLGLGGTRERRAAAYLRLFGQPISTECLEALRRGVRPASRGRPTRADTAPREKNLVLF